MRKITIFKRFFSLLCLFIFLIGSVNFVWAKYPKRPIQLIVPWGAGGGTDSVARTIAMALEQELGQPVNVVNRPGGGSVVGHTVIANSKPDGYTLGLLTGEVNMLHWQGLTDLTYKDFTPIGQINYDYAGVQISATSKYKNLQELIEAFRTESAGTMTASGTGQGGVWHLSFAGLLLDQGIDPTNLKWVPSDGAATAMTDLVAGGIDVAPTSIPEARSMLDAGRVISVGYMGPERHPVFSDIPTLKEELDSDYTQGEWRGIGGPKGMDSDIVATLEAALEKAFNSDIYQDFARKQGFGAEWRNAKDFEQLMIEVDVIMGETIEKIGLQKEFK